MRFPSFSPGDVKSPKLVYLKGAEARFSANDEPEFSEKELIEGEKQRSAFSMDWEQDRAMQEQIHRMRCEGGL